MAAAATVVLYPSPGVGHLVSMVELGKLINTHHPLLSVRILITPEPFETGPTDKYISSVSTTTPSITFHHLATTPIPPDFSLEFIDLAFGIPKLYNPLLHDTLVSISENSTIKAVVLDFFTNAAFEVSSTTLNLPTYYFYTSGASGLSAFLYLPTIHATTTASIKDLNTYLEIPGVPPLHVSDMPVALFDRESNSYKNFITTSNNMARSSGIIANSFVGFEERAVKAIRDGESIPDHPTPPVYFVGPLIASGGQADHDCLKWLDSQPSKSVVFLCFGSMGVFKKEQLKNMAIGLEKSGQRFLWVVRDPPHESSLGSKEVGFDGYLPEGFIARVRDRGLVVRNWAPQPAILSHDSVGGFVSHCGWNSMLEAVVAGVPMVAWPLYAEQKMNRAFLVEEMKLALAVEMAEDGFVTAETVEEKVWELMEGEGGRAVRERVLEMSRRAKAAVEDGGSSRTEFMKLTQSWTAL